MIIKKNVKIPLDTWKDLSKDKINLELKSVSDVFAIEHAAYKKNNNPVTFPADLFSKVQDMLDEKKSNYNDETPLAWKMWLHDFKIAKSQLNEFKEHASETFSQKDIDIHFSFNGHLIISRFLRHKLIVRNTDGSFSIRSNS